MSSYEDVPGSVRIRCGESNAWRYDSIEMARGFYGCNRSDAAAYASHDVPKIAEACKAVLKRSDLTSKQRREIAETLNGHVRGLEFVVEDTTRIETDG